MQNNADKRAARLKQILVVMATAGVIFINYLAGKGYINRTTPGEISDKYSNLLTPDGYAFSIWGLIYLGLIAFSVYQALPSQKNKPRFTKIRTLYIASCAANVAWIYFWHYEQILLSLGAILILLGSLVLINRNLFLEQKTESATQMWIAQIPFNMYFGWVTAATIVNFSVALIFLGVKTSDTVTAFLASLMIAVAAFLAVLIGRNFNSIAYPLAIAWALIAIAVKQQNEKLVFITAIAGALIAMVSIFFRREKLQ